MPKDRRIYTYHYLVYNEDLRDIIRHQVQDRLRRQIALAALSEHYGLITRIRFKIIRNAERSVTIRASAVGAYIPLDAGKNF